MNILEIQHELEYWPDQKLIQEAQQPTGAAPTYLVVTEGERRNKERQAYEAELAKQQQPQATVADETMMELGGGQSMGGIPDVDPNMMQNQMMAQQMPQQQQMQQQMPQQMPQGQPMAMRGGGAIRYQGGEYIDPNLVALGLTIDEEGNIVPIETGYGGLVGLGGVGEGGWLLDYDPFQEAWEDPTAKNISLAGLEAALAGGKSVLAKKGLGLAVPAIKRGWKEGRSKLKGGIDRLRGRLGGTRTTAKQPFDVPPSPFDVIASTTTKTIKPTSLAGKATDLVLDHPIIAGSIAAGAGVPPVIEAISGARVPKTEAEDIPFTSEETAELSSLLNDAAVNLTNLGFGEGGYAEFKNSDKRDQLAFLRSAKAEGKMSKSSVLNTPLNAGATASNIAASRSNIMDEISEMLGSGDQALRDQQSAALIQLGAGIAGGDIAGGLSAAGKEVSALKAARSSEKLKAIMALIEMEYKQGLLNVAQVENIIAEIELLQEAVGQEGSEEKINELYQRLRQHAGGASTTGLSSVSSSWAT